MNELLPPVAPFPPFPPGPPFPPLAVIPLQGLAIAFSVLAESTDKAETRDITIKIEVKAFFFIILFENLLERYKLDLLIIDYTSQI